MAKKTVAEAEPNEPEAPEEAAPEEEAEASGDSVTVTWGTGSRVYSKETHGKDFRKLAKQFAEKESIQGKVA
jgi:hypothetical protein